MVRTNSIENELPQKIGYLDQDVDIANNDPNTIIGVVGDTNIPILSPVVNNSELNQEYFRGRGDSFYFNPSEIDRLKNRSEIEEKFSKIPLGSLIVVERINGSEKTEKTLDNLIKLNPSSNLEMDNEVYDNTTTPPTIASVHHFYCDINYDWRTSNPAPTIYEAYGNLKKTKVWSDFESQGIKYVHGTEIEDDLMERLWGVYDATFDELVSNHPSAQKQSEKDFVNQCKSDSSNIVYCTDRDEVVSALYLIDNVDDCNWLNPEYFRKINESGKTLFVPGISTRLDFKGGSYSIGNISAMSELIRPVTDYTGFATQCTNRSSIYIPPIAGEGTKNSARLDLQQTALIEYPVYKVTNNGS